MNTNHFIVFTIVKIIKKWGGYVDYIRNNFCVKLRRMQGSVKIIYFLFFGITFFSMSFADYTDVFNKIAGHLARQIPKGRTVVVFNILKEGKDETKNSVDFAIKLSAKLAEKCRGKFSVIDRSAGERLAYEERRYKA